MRVQPKLTRRHVLALAAAAGAGRLLGTAAPALGRATAPTDLSAESVTIGLGGGAFPARAAAAGAWATTRVLRAPRRVALAGLVWGDGERPERAQVRARRRGGTWTRWTELPAGGDHAPDGATRRRATEPVWLGPSDELQVRVQGAVAGLRVHAVAVRGRGRGRVTAHTAQDTTTPVIIPRSAWGGDGLPPKETPEIGDVQLAFVHHTVSANDYQPTDSAGIVLSICQYHRDANGWNDIGYNFLVDRYGQIFEGRAGGITQAIVGAQAQGYNRHSTGVAIIGTQSVVPVTDETFASLARLIGWKLAIHGLTPIGQVTILSAGGSSNRYPADTPVTFQRISGHRDGDETTCPGDAAYAQLPALRSRTAAVAPPPSAVPVATPAAPAVTARSAAGRVHAGRSVLVSGAATGTETVTLVIELARGGGRYSYVRRVQATVRNNAYRIRLPLRRPALYRITAKAGATKAEPVFVRAIRRTSSASGGGVAAR
jgi:N-acetylmuramoyl-L-alanine amidase